MTLTMELCECDKYLGREEPCGKYFINGIDDMQYALFSKDVAEKLIKAWNAMWGDGPDI